MTEEMIPIVMFICMALVFCILFWFRYKARSEIQQTLRAVLDKGHELSPEVIDRLGHPNVPKNRDLRYGVIWLAIAVGLALCGFAIPDPGGDALRGTLAGAAFPASLGAAYLLLHWFGGSD